MLFRSGSRIILLCNGALSVREDLLKLIEEERSAIPTLLLATTTHGAYREQHENQAHNVNLSRRLIHAGYGKTYLEDLGNGDGMAISGLWDKAGLNCTSLSSKEMNSMLWRKLAANCVINPLTSIYRCTNGELMLEPSFPAMLEDILKEVVDIATGVINDEGGSDTWKVQD